MSDVYNLGNKVDLRIVKFDETSAGRVKKFRTYKSKIYDILDENKLKLAMPIERGNVILLPTNQEYEIFFYTTNGLYQAQGKVIDRLKENNIFVFIFELTTSVKKNQRREYFRYSCTIDVKYCVVTEHESSLIYEEEIEDVRGRKLEWMDGIIADISGGGMRFTSSEEFENNTYILCKFTLIINGRIKEFCTIVKIISSEKILNKNGQFENRSKYISMSPADTEEVVRYIFAEERKSRKNRKS